MQENFSQGINILQNTDINSENLPSTQQANNLSDNTVTNAQLLTFLKTLQKKMTDWKQKHLQLILRLLLTLTLRLKKYFKRYFFSCGCCPL